MFSDVIPPQKFILITAVFMVRLSRRSKALAGQKTLKTISEV